MVQWYHVEFAIRRPRVQFPLYPFFNNRLPLLNNSIHLNIKYFMHFYHFSSIFSLKKNHFFRIIKAIYILIIILSIFFFIIRYFSFFQQPRNPNYIFQFYFQTHYDHHPPLNFKYNKIYLKINVSNPQPIFIILILIQNLELILMVPQIKLFHFVLDFNFYDFRFNLLIRNNSLFFDLI